MHSTLKIIAQVLIIIFSVYACSYRGKAKNEDKKEEIIETPIETPIEEAEVLIESDSVFENKYKVFICMDTAMTQMDMNICAWNRFLYFDSILTVKHTRLLKYFDRQIEEDKSKDYKELENYNIRLKEVYIESHYLWKASRDKNEEIMSVMYESGSIRPLMMTEQLIDDTKRRIIYLTGLNDHFH